MNCAKLCSTIVLLLWSTLVRAQLDVTVSPVKLEGNKAVVKLNVKNDLTNSVESARASIVLLDPANKSVGQATHWVIGGSKDAPSLAAGATNVYFFVITSDKPFATKKVTAKMNFNRVVLRGGKLADLKEDVKIQNLGN